MVVLFSIWLLMLIISLRVLIKPPFIYEIKGIVNFTRKNFLSYTLGLHHTAFVGHSRATGELYKIESLYVGLLLVTIQISSYKMIARGPAGFSQDDPPAAKEFSDN
ncbi:hypothetical protein HGH93_21585 [Chitinophaga polysaccharea]|uniref:hypothetical protein n=1 Tax=Chitinophaga polysaccharea TaxID=1293035 RepID=UPI001455541D|nr:hypothetical protein [Chitinophaga polysaccharea]NLR60717.1 hypothetical protein [Chitinophaga polysaccharea]